MAEKTTPSLGNGSTQGAAVYVGVIEAALDVLSVRVHALLALVGGIAMFAFAVYDPLPVRSYTAAAYAVLVLAPLIWAMAKRN